MNELNSYVILESREELRSRFSHLETAFRYLSKWVNATCNKYTTKGYSLPIPNPRHFDFEIQREIQNIRQKMDEMNVTFEADNVIEGLRLMRTVDMLLAILNSNLSFLEQFVNQRISSTAIPLEFVHYFQTGFFEISTLNKIYICGDCVLTAFFEKIMGAEWMETEKCFPVTFFGGEYQISQINYITQIPLADIYRCRFWSLLAHEVGHIKLLKLEGDQYQIFIDLLGDIRNKLIGPPMLIAHYFAERQIHELLSDLIGMYVCGPAYLNSAAERLRPLIPVECVNENLILAPEIECLARLRNRHIHPPTDIRIKAMLRMSSFLGFDDDWISSLGDFVKIKHSQYLNSSIFKNYITTYDDIIKDFFNQIISFIQAIIPQSNVFNHTNWETVKNSNFETFNTPIDLLNMIWINRKKTFHFGEDTTYKDFFKRRKIEIKPFACVIKNLYDYYSKHCHSLLPGE